MPDGERTRVLEEALLSPEETEAVLARIHGDQTVRRLPHYKPLLASAADKLRASLAAVAVEDDGNGEGGRGNDDI